MHIDLYLKTDTDTISEISVTETITEMELIDPALMETETKTIVIVKTEII